MKITDRQKEVLFMIIGFIRANGYAPTMKEISHIMGFSSANSAQEHTNYLQTKGYLIKTKYLARAMTITDKAMDLYNVEFSS